MNNIIIDLNDLNESLYEDTIIREGEHNASQLVITLSADLTGYQNNLVFRLNDEAPLIASNVPNVAGVITYPIPNTVTYNAGTLRVEIQSYNSTSMLTKSLVIPFKVTKSIGGIPVTIPPTLYGLEGSVSATPNTFLVRDSVGAGKVDSLDVSLTPATPPASLPTGKLQWDATYKLLDMGIQGTTVGASLQIGQDLVVWARNTSGQSLDVGTIVAITGATGELPSVTVADANGSTQQTRVLGVVGGFPIPNNSNGYIVLAGFCSGVNTSAFNEGDVIYLSETAGAFTNVPPLPPSSIVSLGYVVKKAGAGKIYVKIDREAIGASVLIQDAGGYFNSTTIEGALQEIGAKLVAHGITMP